jgi:hypothetical protein
MKTVVFPAEPVKLVTTTERVERVERRQLIYDIVEEIKIISDVKPVTSGVGKFKWEISDDLWLMGLDIVQVKIYVTTTGGACTCSLTNKGSVDTPKNWAVLTTPLTIAAGAYSAKTDRGTLVGIDETKNDLDEDDRLWLNVLVAGGMGLGLILTFGRDRRP